MKEHRPLVVTGVACLAVLISALWLWEALSEARYEAVAVVAVPAAAANPRDGDAGESSVEEAILGPENLTAAAALLHDRLISLPLSSPFDPEADYLADHLRMERGEADEFRVTSIADDADLALQMLTAVIDAWRATATGLARTVIDPAATESETERRQIAEAIQRQQTDIDGLLEILNAGGDRLEPASADELARLEGELIELRRGRVEAEGQLAEARRDLIEKNAPVESVVARIAEGPLRTSILERLKLARLNEDLQSQKALLQKWSSIYGRKHPRMTEVRARVELLDRQVSGLWAELPDFADRPIAEAVPALVLQPFERDVADRRQAEQELQQRLDGLVERLTARQETERRLGEARQELAFLHGEHDRVRKQIESSRRGQTSRGPELIEAPSVSPGPLAPQAGAPLAVTCLAGLGLFAAAFWQIRTWRRSPASASTASTTAAVRRPVLPPQSPRPPQRPRFRSHEEQQVRLKMLSASTSAFPG